MDMKDEIPNPLKCLPVEVVAVITQYLSVKDLGSCCATSCGMRELFNDDIMWKPRCTKELTEYLKTTPCKVKPKFVNPRVKNSTLSPIPQWRIAFMRENHLWNNWRQGRHEKEVIISTDSEQYTLCHIFHTSNCVLALYEDKIELLDVRGYPAVNATETINFATSLSHRVKAISGDNMILTLYKSGVHVYHIDLNTRQSSLKHVFFFEESQKIASKEPENIKKLFDARINQPFFLPLYVNIGRFFVGVLEGESTMHIWDLQSGLKLKEETCPLKHSTIVAIEASQSMDVVLAIKQRGQNKNTYIAYSLTKLSYLPFRETMESGDQLFVKNDTVGIWGNDRLDIYNYKKSKVLLKDCPAQSYPQFYMNNFVFIQNSSLKMFNPSTEVLESLPLDDIDWFLIVPSRFVEVRRNGNVEFWELDRSFKKLKKTSKPILWFTACGFYFNKAATRYIVRDCGVGFLYNFW